MKQKWAQSSICSAALLLAFASSSAVASESTTDCRLRVIVQPQWDGAPLVNGSPHLTNIAGQVFSVTRLDLFVSDFSLHQKTDLAGTSKWAGIYQRGQESDALRDRKTIGRRLRQIALQCGVATGNQSFPAREVSVGASTQSQNKRMHSGGSTVTFSLASPVSGCRARSVTITHLIWSATPCWYPLNFLWD